MDQIYQILTHKLKFINQHSDTSKFTSSQDYENHMNELFYEKKKENLRELMEIRLLQSIINKKIEAPFRIQQFYDKSLKLMKIIDPSFQASAQDVQNQNFISVIVDLFIAFYNGQKCSQRAEEIKNTYKKKLCEDGQFIPTILNWFAQWIRKRFTLFLKNSMHNHYLGKRYEESKRLNLQTQNADRPKEESAVQVEPRFNIAGSNFSNQLKLNNLASKSVLGELKRNRSIVAIEKEAVSPVKGQRIKLTNIDDASDDENEFACEFGKFNKQIFICSYLDELNYYYKLLETSIPDIDSSFLKRFRKIDKKKQLHQKLKVVAKNIIKYQNVVKATIANYYSEYNQRIASTKDSLMDYKHLKLKSEENRTQTQLKSNSRRNLKKRYFLDHQNTSEKIEVGQNQKMQYLGKKIKKGSNVDQSSNFIQLHQTLNINLNLPEQASNSRLLAVNFQKVKPKKSSKSKNPRHFSLSLNLDDSQKISRQKDKSNQKALQLESASDLRFQDFSSRRLHGKVQQKQALRLPKINKI